MQRNFGSLSDEKDENLKELVLQNELKVGVLGGLSCSLHHLGAPSIIPELGRVAPLAGQRRAVLFKYNVCFL